MGLIGMVVKVWEGLRIAVGADRCRDAEGVESGHRGDPRGDGRGEAFGEEGAEGLIFPGLDVAGGPVVEEAYAKDVVRRIGDGNRGPESIGLADVEGNFELVVESGGGAEGRGELVAGRAGLSVRSSNGDTAGEDG